MYFTKPNFCNSHFLLHNNIFLNFCVYCALNLKATFRIDKKKTADQLLFYVNFIYCLISGMGPAMPAANRLTYCHELLSVPGRAAIFFLTTTVQFPIRHWAPPCSHPVSTWG